MTVISPKPDDQEELANIVEVEDDASLAEADLFDDENDLVSLDETEEDADEVIGEDDDNPYEEPDDALPDDREERSISRDISREGSRFGEV